MNNFTYRIWPLLSFTEIPAYLEAMERKGLRFERMGASKFLAQFRRVEPAETAYCWDYFESRKWEDIQPYLDLCEGGGWEIAWQFGKHKIFRQMGKRKPIPIQTDEALWLANRKKSVKGYLLPGVIYAIIMLVAYRTFSNLEMGVLYYRFQQMQYGLLGLGGVALVGWQLIWGFKLTFGRRGMGEEPKPFGSGKEILYTAVKILGLLWIISFTGASVGAGFEGSSGFQYNIIAGVLWICWPLEGLQERLHYGQDYPKDCRMKGQYGYKRRTCRVAAAVLWSALLIWTMGLSYLQWGHSKDELHSENWYCEEIYIENRDSWLGNKYYVAKNTKYGDKVVKALLPKGEKKSQILSAASSEEAELNRMLTTRVEDENIGQKEWDVIYSYEMFYLIRRGNEIWKIAAFTDESILQYTVPFLEQTGF